MAEKSARFYAGCSVAATAATMAAVMLLRTELVQPVAKAPWEVPSQRIAANTYWPGSGQDPATGRLFPQRPGAPAAVVVDAGSKAELAKRQRGYDTDGIIGVAVFFGVCGFWGWRFFEDYKKATAKPEEK